MTRKIKGVLGRFLKDESGLSAVEYGLLAAGIVMGLWAVIEPIGEQLETIYTNIGTAIGVVP